MNILHEYQGLLAINQAHKTLKHQVFITVICLLSLSLALIAFATCLYIYTHKSIVPYVIGVDSHGVVLASDRLQKAEAIPKAAIVTELCSFIKNVRLISSDQDVQSQSVIKSYAYLKDKNIINELNDYFIKNNPLQLSESQRRSVAIVNVLYGSNGSAQIDFVETTTSLDSGAVKDRTMRALLVYEIDLDSVISTEGMLLNPLGIFIKEYSVSEIIATPQTRY
ncbi:conjugal transfer protein TrbF [Anaerobiospirillum thomasii]|uniref:Conjugal transfer protein TrbF n=2 Tax=Anaerobiospirillum thomasii TaxID=179995 RepID=A0A2X0WWB4_9GAMM|nr:conjugal transfer protein TrbF [Anaerobiospirillum thomasii]SPT71586.1 conjugal transfer protein TrbF [Anaerobiospirillum thomasii]